jgi:hypothetical protein
MCWPPRAAAASCCDGPSAWNPKAPRSPPRLRKDLALYAGVASSEGPEAQALAAAAEAAVGYLEDLATRLAAG